LAFISFLHPNCSRMGPTCHSLSLLYLPPVPSISSPSLCLLACQCRTDRAPTPPRRPRGGGHGGLPTNPLLPVVVLSRSPPRTDGAFHSSAAASRWWLVATKVPLRCSSRRPTCRRACAPAPHAWREDRAAQGPGRQ
jgi:hypothetical protein